MASIVNTSRIAIVGLGQLGGSLALRLQQLSPISVFGVARREESVRTAVAEEMIEAGSTDPAEVLPVVDITFICLPVSATIAFVADNLQFFRPGSIVTDVGSVKGPVVSRVRDRLYQHGTYFIGGHPMAGSEKSGLAHARADLYQGATVFLTPTEQDEPEAINLVAEFWRQIGAQPFELPADQHDHLVAAASHAPHLIASAIASAVLAKGDPDGQRLACAGGFRDTTRIASSDPAMWTEICLYNRDAVLAALTAFEGELSALRKAVAGADGDGLSARLEAARQLRDSWAAAYEARQFGAE